MMKSSENPRSARRKKACRGVAPANCQSSHCLGKLLVAPVSSCPRITLRSCVVVVPAETFSEGHWTLLHVTEAMLPWCMATTVIINVSLLRSTLELHQPCCRCLTTLLEGHCWDDSATRANARMVLHSVPMMLCLPSVAVLISPEAAPGPAPDVCPRSIVPPDRRIEVKGVACSMLHDLLLCQGSSFGASRLPLVGSAVVLVDKRWGLRPPWASRGHRWGCPPVKGPLRLWGLATAATTGKLSGFA